MAGGPSRRKSLNRCPVLALARVRNGRFKVSAQPSGARSSACSAVRSPLRIAFAAGRSLSDLRDALPVSWAAVGSNAEAKNVSRGSAGFLGSRSTKGSLVLSRADVLNLREV